MANYRLELPAQRITLDPIRHVAAIASTSGNRTVRIHKGHIGFDVFETIFKVFVGSATPLAIYP
jgi:hypothetical protein